MISTLGIFVCITSITYWFLNCEYVCVSFATLSNDCLQSCQILSLKKCSHFIACLAYLLSSKPALQVLCLCILFQKIKLSNSKRTPKVQYLSPSKNFISLVYTCSFTSLDTQICFNRYIPMPCPFVLRAFITLRPRYPRSNNLSISIVSTNGPQFSIDTISLFLSVFSLNIMCTFSLIGEYFRLTSKTLCLTEYH